MPGCRQEQDGEDATNRFSDDVLGPLAEPEIRPSVCEAWPTLIQDGNGLRRQIWVRVPRGMVPGSAPNKVPYRIEFIIFAGP